MKAKATPKFWQAYARLPRQVQQRARLAYQKWKRNPKHPGLHFKRVDEEEAIYSVRISDDYRALGVLLKDTVIWYWIGSHDEYLRLLK